MMENYAIGFPEPNALENYVVFGGDDVSFAVAPIGTALKPPPPIDSSLVTKPTFYLKADGVVALDLFLNDCLTDVELDLVGRKEIKDAVGKLLRDRIFSANQAETLKEEIRPLLKELKNSIIDREVNVHIPGLMLSISELVVGSVTLRSANKHSLILVERVREAVASSANSPESKKKLSEENAGLIGSTFGKQGSIATVSVRSGSDRATDIALDFVRSSLSILQFYVSAIYGRSGRRYMVMPDSDVWQKHAASFITKEGGANFKFNISGYDDVFVIDQETHEHMVDHHFFSVLAPLYNQGRKLNETEAAIKTAIWWLSRGSLSPINSESLIFFVVATERLVILEGEETTKEKWENRMLWLIGGDQKNERLSILSDLGKYYRLRSRIVHQGVTAVDRGDATRMSVLASEALYAFLTLWKDLPTQKGIVESLDAKARGI